MRVRIAATYSLTGNNDCSIVGIVTVLVKCDVVETPLIVRISRNDPQPVASILRCLALPTHIGDTANILVDGKPIYDDECWRQRAMSGHLRCVRVHCGRLHGGVNPGGTSISLALRSYSYLRYR